MKSLATILVGTTLALGANAATVSFNFSNPLQTTEISQTGTLGLFDSSLGTLTGASIVVNGNAIKSFSATNTATQPRLASITSSLELFWDSSLSALDPFLLDPISLSATSGALSYAAGESKSFGPFNLSAFNADNLVSILGVLQTAGGGSFSLTCDSISSLTVVGGGGNIGTGQSSTAGCGASIEYTYDTQITRVPEPASLALLGLGLAGLGISRRKKA